jgi:TolA-binding protein
MKSKNIFRVHGPALLLLPIVFTITLAAAGCGTRGSGRHAADPRSQADPELAGRIEKQQIIIDDLSDRITELENILLKQHYDINKLKKIVNSYEIQGFEIGSGEVAEAEGKDEGFDEAYDGPSDYSIFLDVGKKGDKGSNRPLLQLHGAAGKPSHASHSPKSADVSSLLQEAAVAANYVPMKIGTAPIEGAGAQGQALPGGPTDEDGGVKKTAPVDPYKAGVAKYKEGKWQDAALYFDIYLKQDADPAKAPNALFLKAESLYQAGKIVDALGVFELLEAKHPAFSRVPEAKFRIGRCCEKISDDGRAVAIYEDIVQDYPKSKVAAKALKRIKTIKKK